jgi:hypothetical protein
MNRGKMRFETVPLAEVPDIVVLREPGRVEKIAHKREPYAVPVERRESTAPDNAFLRPRERRR